MEKINMWLIYHHETFWGFNSDLRKVNFVTVENEDLCSCFMFRRTQRRQQKTFSLRFQQRLMMTDKDSPTREDGCRAGGAAGRPVAAAELCGAVGGAAASGTAGSVRILSSSSAAIDSLMSLSRSTDADSGKTRWVSAWGQLDGLDNGQTMERTNDDNSFNYGNHKETSYCWVSVQANVFLGFPHLSVSFRRQNVRLTEQMNDCWFLYPLKFNKTLLNCLILMSKSDSAYSAVPVFLCYFL